MKRRPKLIDGDEPPNKIERLIPTSPCTDGEGNTSHDYIGERCIRCGAAETPPSDFKIRSLIHYLNRAGLNMELRNIAMCMASSQHLDWTEDYEQAIHEQLKRMVRAGDIARRRFLPGRPYYTPA